MPTLCNSTSLPVVDSTCTPNTTAMPVIGSMKNFVPAQPPPKQRKNNQLDNDLFNATEDLDIPQAEPFRRPLAKSVVQTAKAVLHEVLSVMINSESVLTPFSGNAGTKISCTVSAFKIALRTSRPAV